MEFQGKCYRCDTTFSLERDALVLFNEVRKRDYVDFRCSSCGYEQKIARFTPKSNLVATYPL